MYEFWSMYACYCINQKANECACICVEVGDGGARELIRHTTPTGVHTRVYTRHTSSIPSRDTNFRSDTSCEMSSDTTPAAVEASAPPAAATDAAPAPASAPAAAAPSAELLAQLARQVEYYLSDTNLVRDAFFRKAIVAAEDGCGGGSGARVGVWPRTRVSRRRTADRGVHDHIAACVSEACVCPIWGCALNCRCGCASPGSSISSSWSAATALSS